MKCRLEVLKFRKSFKKERNPGIKRAIENALDAWYPPSHTVDMYIYIDGDPEHVRRVFLN